MAEALSHTDSSAMAHDLDSLVQQLTATAESIRNNPASLEGHDKERSKLIESAQALLKLVKPDDSMMESMILMVQFTVIRLFVGWKVFESIPKIGSILYSDLAATVNADTSLIREFRSIRSLPGLTINRMCRPSGECASIDGNAGAGRD